MQKAMCQSSKLDHLHEMEEKKSDQKHMLEHEVPVDFGSYCLERESPVGESGSEDTVLLFPTGLKALHIVFAYVQKLEFP